MVKYIIKGGKKLSGSIKIAGNKNEVLPIMAACLLIPEDVVLENVPDIKDVEVMGTILTRLGASVERIKDHTLKINTKNVINYVVPVDLATRLRASVLLVGPLYARFGKVTISHPGGDLIGKRGIDTHLRALKNLGAEIHERSGLYEIVKRKEYHPRSSIFLDEPSVTATENILMAIIYRAESIVLENTAQEPHVKSLISFLNKAGANIIPKGGTLLEISGNKQLESIQHTIAPDYIEEGTFAALAAATQSHITIKNGYFDDNQAMLYALASMHVDYVNKGKEIEILPSSMIASEKRIQSGPHPNFPTDLMSPFIVLATQVSGQTLFHDPMYESRMFFTDKLIRMGAHITICDPHRVIVYGPTKLYPQHLYSPDIRAGMALVIAALCAKGESVIENVEMIERGYENLPKRLSLLGASIVRHE